MGALCAALGLYVLTWLFAACAVPLSVLGIVLGLRGHSAEAIGIGALGIAIAVVAFLNSDVFWIAFGLIGGALLAG